MSQPSQWLNDFVTQVTASMTMLNEPVEYSCHVYCSELPHSEVEWEVTLFAEPQTLGGRLEHYPVQPAMSVDVVSVMTVFDSLDSCRWQSETIALDDELGPHVSVEGTYRGHRIWLRLLSRAPESLTSNVFTASTARDC